MNQPQASFAPGQRWISNTEPDLGLGTVLEVSARQVTIAFLASGESRVYARESAPVTRIRYASGDAITNQARQRFTVQQVADIDGLLVYSAVDDDGQTEAVPESDLSHELRFNHPKDRLFAGQLDKRRWYNLRREVLALQHRLHGSAVRGLAGGRISLIPHQIYIAHEVSNREHPRVLLADEVGLGKTIEAGLILHRKLVTWQISRVLIIVPEALINQWLVEMLRRFNLRFHLLAADAAEHGTASGSGNPFLDHQLILCSLESLLEDPLLGESAIEAEWDMLVVDEAHHLTWQPGSPSAAYTLVETLADHVPSVLLLTATPEQLGLQGHFSRLRLLDPARFSDFQQFLDAEQQHESIARIATALDEDLPLDETMQTVLAELPGIGLDEAQIRELAGEPQDATALSTRLALLNRLLDQHGTSRVLFRNTRASISGFPARQLIAHDAATLDNTDDYAHWIISLLKSIAPARALLICSATKTVLSIQTALKNLGTRCAVFHEDMSIVERDRAAAWFADTEDGTQLLCCSEIGSEGRNFQFLHHLITFELPATPDLLEQRIGRLDRIGQTRAVSIHVPYAEGSRDHALLRWYHEGLDAFEATSATGSAVREQLAESFDQAIGIDDDSDKSPQALDELIDNSRELNRRLKAQLEAGRDRLLELNSNRIDHITEQLDQLQRDDRDLQLHDTFVRILDGLGVDSEAQTNDTLILHPGDHMQVGQFPGLPDDGLTVTFDRNTALEREEVSFLTRDHPMVEAAIDLVLGETFGQTNAEVIDTDLLPRGVVYVETNFTWHCSAEKRLNIDRYFPAALQRYLLGSNRKDYSAQLHRLDLDAYRTRSDRNKLRQFLQHSRQEINLLLQYSESLASNATTGLQARAAETIDAELLPEIDRLTTLKQFNPGIHQQEIDLLAARRQALHQALTTASPTMLSVSVLLNP